MNADKTELPCMKLGVASESSRNMQTLDKTGGRGTRSVLMRRGEAYLFVGWGIGTLLFSHNVVGAKVFLIYLYGWTRVSNEHLTIVKMPKGYAWVVSNGDLIDHASTGVHFVIAAICWFALFFATYPLLRLLLPRSPKPQTTP
jgi:hypothetical protein